MFAQAIGAGGAATRISCCRIRRSTRRCQHANAAVAIAALHALRAKLGWNPDAIARGVVNARADARLQRFALKPELIVDVAHNPQAARVLAAWLRAHPSDGRTLAVFGALGDKDVRGIVEPLRDVVTDWQLAGLAHDSPRGFAADALRDLVRGTHADVNIAGTHDDVETALAAAFMRAARGDRVVAFGSFFVAAAALQFARARGRGRVTRFGDAGAYNRVGSSGRPLWIYR